MKKVILIILTLALTLACAINTFAWSAYEVVEFSKLSEGLPINAKTGDGTGSGTLTIRNDWSVNRNPANNTDVTKPDDTWNYNSVVVTDEDDIDEFLVAEVVAPQVFVSKYTGYSDFCIGDTIAFELKKGTVSGFAGAVLNYGKTDILPQATKTTNLDEYFVTMYPAKSTTEQYAIATGYGFTFLPNSDTTVRVFVRCFDGNDLDVIYYDIDLGVDLTKKYYTYCFYYDKGETKFVVANALDNEVFYGMAGSSGNPFPEDEEIGGRVCATIKFSNPANVTETIDGNALTEKYCRTASILDGTGAEVASTQTALVSEQTNNDAALCFLGEGTTCRVKTLIWTDALVCPTDTFPDTSTPAPATDAPTAAPETATPAPATDAPATEEPDIATNPTDAPASSSGCGGFVGAGLFGLALAALVVVKKKQ